MRQIPKDDETKVGNREKEGRRDARDSLLISHVILLRDNNHFFNLNLSWLRLKVIKLYLRRVVDFAVTTWTICTLVIIQ